MKKRLAMIGIAIAVLSILISGAVFAVSSWQSTQLTATGIITVMAVTTTALPPDGGGGSGSSSSPAPNIAGISHSEDGIVADTVSAVSVDGDASLSISAGTVAKDKNGNALWTVRVDPATNVPPVPEGNNVVGIPYEFTPNGATFNPAITITFRYDPAEVPIGTDLVVVFWNGSEWVELDDVVIDPVTGTVQGKTTHFTKFAVIAVPKPVPTTVTTTSRPNPPPPSPTATATTTTTTTTTTSTTPVVTSTTTTTIETTTTAAPSGTTTITSATTTVVPDDEGLPVASIVIFVLAGLCAAVVIILIVRDVVKRNKTKK